MAVRWALYKRFPLETDLSDVNAFLLGQGHAHIFTEESGQQLLWVSDSVDIATLDDFFARYFRGEFHLRRSENMNVLRRPEFSELILASPLTCIFIFLGFLGYLMGDAFKHLAFFQFFSFLPFTVIADNYEIWRLITPAFLHFSVPHFLMNSLWMYLLGKKLEVRLGAVHYVSLFLLTALGGNILQYMVSGSIYFGGLSGVVYGYVGFFTISMYYRKDPLLSIAPGIIGMSVVALLLGFMGALDWMTSGGIANWAHLGGFLAGATYALYYYLNQQNTSDTSTQ